MIRFANIEYFWFLLLAILFFILYLFYNSWRRRSSNRYGNKKQIDGLMPDVSELKPIYNNHIRKVAKTNNLSIARADDFFSQNTIMDEIWSAITQASILVADCTNKNTNVFYEIGIAHAIGKPVILITQNQDDVPFDLRHIRYIQYEYTTSGMAIFENTLTKTILEIKKDLEMS